MQISHIEVRRHPIWQREIHRERHVASPARGLSPRGKRALLVVVGMAAIAAVLLLVAE